MQGHAKKTTSNSVVLDVTSTPLKQQIFVKKKVSTASTIGSSKKLIFVCIAG
jgi:hypothetical protein